MKDPQFHSTPRAGDILIAQPAMPENLFSRTLVYLHSFSEEGALGFVLNRPLGQTLERMTGGQAVPDLLQELPLFYGGPVQSDHFILAHFTAQPLSHEFRCEMNPDPEKLNLLLAEENSCVRAFMGYAGWSAGQLEEELERNDWGWVPSDVAYLQESPGTGIWELVVSGDQCWQLLRTYFPRDAERN